MNINFNDLQTKYNSLENELRELTDRVPKTRDLNSAERMLKILQRDMHNFSIDLEVAISTDTDQEQLLNLKDKIKDLSSRVDSLHQNVQQRIDTIARIIIEPSDKSPVTNGPKKRKFEEEEYVSNKKPHLESQEVQSQDVFELSFQLTLPNGDVISSESTDVPYKTCQNLSIISAKVNVTGKKKFSFEFQGEKGDIQLYQRLFEHLKRFFNNPADYSAGDLHQHDDIDVLFKLLQTAEMYDLNGLKENVGAQLALLLDSSELEASKETLLGYFHLLQHPPVRQILAKKIAHLLMSEDNQLLEKVRGLVAQHKKLPTVLERFALLNMMSTLDTNDVASLQKIPLIQQLLPKRMGKDVMQFGFHMTMANLHIESWIQDNMTVREVNNAIYPKIKNTFREHGLTVPDRTDFKMIIAGLLRKDNDKFRDYAGPTLVTVHLISNFSSTQPDLSNIHDESLRNRVREGITYIQNLDRPLQRGLYDQEIDISILTQYIKALEEALPIRELLFQPLLDKAKKVLDMALVVNSLVHLGGRKYDSIQSKLKGEALEELSHCNTEKSTFLQRLTNELKRVYDANVDINETIQSYTMRVESALHMVLKALEILQEDVQSDKDIQQFFLDTIDRIWDSYLIFLDEKISVV